MHIGACKLVLEVGDVYIKLARMEQKESVSDFDKKIVRVQCIYCVQVDEYSRHGRQLDEGGGCNEDSGTGFDFTFFSFPPPSSSLQAELASEVAKWQ